MQSAETVLGVLRERGERGLPCTQLYRQLFNPQLYLLAYGRIYAAVTASGRKARGARAVDLLIAATACAASLPLYTRNGADFEGLEGLVVVVVV